MTELRATIGVSGLTRLGQRAVARSMYAKGHGFLGAAVLLRRQGGYESVVLHLLCQGLEIVLKAALLFKDFDLFHSQLRRPLGHNLELIVQTAASTFGLHPMRPALAEEIQRLSNRYEQHLLRYGTIYDVFVDPSTIPSELLLKRTAAMLRLMRRQLPELGAAETTV